MPLPAMNVFGLLIGSSPTMWSTTSSIVMPVVSTTIASSVSVSGLWARVESLRSRAMIAASISSTLPPISPTRRSRPHPRRGGDEQLQRRVGEHDRTDVATLDDAAAVLGDPLPLTLHEHRAHVGIGGDLRHRLGDLAAADRRRGVDTVDDHRVVVDLDLDRRRHRRHLGEVALGDAAPQRGERHRPVHRAGVEVVEPEPRRRRPARPCSCRRPPGRRWRSRAAVVAVVGAVGHHQSVIQLVPSGRPSS